MLLDVTCIPHPQLSSSYVLLGGWMGQLRLVQLPLCGSWGCPLLLPCLHPSSATAPTLSPLHSSAC